MKKVLPGLAVMSVAVAALGASPAARNSLTAWYDRLTEWTPAARQADPVRFLCHAETALRQDEERFRGARRQLAGELTQVSEAILDHEARRDRAAGLAEEFQREYRRALSKGQFPIQVRQGAYTQPQAEQQVKMLLREAQVHGDAVARLREAQTKADEELTALAVRLDETAGQLAMLPVSRSLVRAHGITERSQRTVRDIQEVLQANAAAPPINPVRPLEDLLRADPSAAQHPISDDVVRHFLRGAGNAVP